MEEGTAASCTCERCVSACHFKPGWFLPGEAEAVADHLGVSLQELFDTKLAVDYHTAVADHGATYLLSPAVLENAPGQVFPFDPTGTCAFLTPEGRCGIHAVKPFECRVSLHGNTDAQVTRRHTAVATAWLAHQAQIAQLLGREPTNMLGTWLQLFGDAQAAS